MSFLNLKMTRANVMMTTAFVLFCCVFTFLACDQDETAHNEYLQIIMDELTTNKNVEEVYNESLALLRTHGVEHCALNAIDIERIASFDPDLIDELNIDGRIDDDLVRSALEAIVKESDLVTFKSQIATLEEASTDLSNSEQDGLAVFCEVAKMSEKFWSKRSNARKFNWGKLLAADALGAYAGFVRVGVFGAVPGVGNSALAGAAASGAAIGSASNAILQLDEL